MGAGTLNAEPRSTSDSVRIDTLSTAIRVNLKNCSEAVAGANLPNAILARCNLSGADLSGASMARANLSDANLIDANLSEVNLFGANLSGANLSGANLTGVFGWSTMKGKDSIKGLDTATGVPD